MDFTEMILLDFPADYDFDSPGIIHIGDNGDIAAYICGDFTGPCIIFCHGNGETAVSEKELFDELAASGISVISPDYRGYGMSEGKLSEEGCYEAAHAAYDYLKEEGVLALPIIYPGVEEGRARLRFFVSASHSEAQIDEACAKISRLLPKAQSRSQDFAG